MNKQQKEVQQAFLNSEEEVLQLLNTIYHQAQMDVEQKIIELYGRQDVENLQSIIYQADYQKAIKKQIDSILDDLNSNQFKTVAEYLEKCYEDGYVGTMYDIQNQGIPITMPIDQKAVVRAVKLDSKINGSMYSHFGERVDVLKKDIAREIARGISTGTHWNLIAKNIKSNMMGDYRNPKGAYAYAVRIARTEGHRIQVQSAMDAQANAKEAGADIVKQWDAALDKRTRPHHQLLDGQIRELDEPFEVNGMTVDAPGMFGRPSEDCNCRCALLQRARWALDEDELATLKERAEYFGLDKAKDFDDFKQKYLNFNTSVSVEETRMITKKHMSNAYSVNRNLVNSKSYHDKFEGITEHKSVNESIYQETMRMLEHRDGTDFEDLKIFDNRDGHKIVENIKSTKSGATGLTEEQYLLYLEHNGEKVILHNHPNGSRPSFTDIATLFENEDVVASIVAGHDGTVHVISKPNRSFDIDNFYKASYNDYKEIYSHSDIARIHALDGLYALNVFEYERR